MLEVEVVLDFNCCCCGHDMGVTLHCKGKGLKEGPDTIASVKVPCPTCGDINQLLFSPDGTLHSVIPPYNAYRELAFSVN